MGEIVERIAKSLATARREREETAAAVYRVIESGDFSGTNSATVAKLWESAQRADELYDNKLWLIRRDFPDFSDAIIDRSQEL